MSDGGCALLQGKSPRGHRGPRGTSTPRPIETRSSSTLFPGAALSTPHTLTRRDTGAGSHGPPPTRTKAPRSRCPRISSASCFSPSEGPICRCRTRGGTGRSQEFLPSRAGRAQSRCPLRRSLLRTGNMGGARQTISIGGILGLRDPQATLLGIAVATHLFV